MVRSRFFSSWLLAAALALSAMGTACAEHHYGSTTPYYSDYQVWNHDEIVYYQTWARENHRDEHRDFRRIPPEEQKEYWTWRHSYGDRDHDRR